MKSWTLDKRINVLLGLYVAALCASNFLGGKLMPIGFGERGLTVSIIMFPFLFLITDIVGEVAGKKKANEFVSVGLISLCVMLIWQVVSLALPSATPNEWYEVFNESYGTIFSTSVAFTAASIAAFFFGQYVDVAVYHVFKRKHKGKLLWVRNNVSTIVGQFVDSAIWVLIAFSPQIVSGDFTLLSIFSIVIIPFWLAKVVVALFDTPLAYLGVRWLRAGEKLGKTKAKPAAVHAD